MVQGHGQKTIVPVAVTVAATAKQDATGQLTEALTFGGAQVDAAQRDRLYNNGSVVDAKDWAWRAEAGDWRFFYFDVPTAPPRGTQFLASTQFAGPAPHNDLDTLVFGRTVNSYQLTDGSDSIFAPYVLGTVGASQNTNVGAGVWLFNAATGSNQELISGDESVELVNPPDGNYQIWVHGFTVTGTPTFPLTLDAVQGKDLTVSGLPSGPVQAGTPVTVHVAFSKAMTAGQDYKGELQLGPPVAPTLLSVPVVIHRQ